ncbi:MAG: ATP-binding protein [Myxococcales bacterium]|nr:ATP-binding protein [Myxococcales bacterium]
MSRPTPLRLRSAIAVVFVGWAVFGLVASATLFFAQDARPWHPFVDTQVGAHAVIARLAPSALGSAAQVGDVILEVNGAPYGEVLQRGSGWLRAGVRNAYLLEKRDGSRVVAALAPEPIGWALTPRALLLHGMLLAVALIYLVTGGTAWWLKPERAEGWALLLFCCTMAVQLASTMPSDLAPWGWQRAAINAPLIGASLFYLFTTYPIEPHWVVRYRRVQLVPYALAAGLVALTFFGSALGLPRGAGLWISYCFSLGLLIVSLAVVAVERSGQGEGPLRDRASLVFLAALLSFAPILVLFLAEWIFRTPYPHQIGLLWTFVFPVSMGYGIVRRQLFEIRVFAKSSAAYGAATLAITGVFALSITAADLVVSRLDISFRWFQLTFLFFAILAFNPLRNRLQAFVDRVFDRDREAYRVAVREISEAMVSMLSLSEIADRILIALTDTMGVDLAMVMLLDENAKSLRPVASRGEWWDEALALEIGTDHPIWRHLWMRREDLSRMDFDDEPDVEIREACRDVFDTLEVELLVPILFGVDLLGVIAVGRKLSGDRLGWDDRTLLRTLANQSSIAIENAKAFDQIAKLNETLEARVEERTAELREAQVQLSQAEKMKSLGQLVAGVAHELNNPIGFVHANLQLLDEFVKKLLDAKDNGEETEKIREAISKLLMRSREGTERVKKIVQDLRTFSRVDQADLQDSDLNEEIERALTLMEPRFKSGVSVERDFGALPSVRCYAGQLNQVFLNLLMNASDAMQGRGTIRIRTRRHGDGVRLEFSDDGPGIPPQVIGRIFDPFFTTKPVGVGTGLGLSLSHSIIERHGGKFTVDSEAGVGTTFAIDLPLDVPPAAQ